MRSRGDYFNNVQPTVPGLARAVHAYDSRLFLRLNTGRGGRWELWRWKQTSPIPTNPSADDYGRKAVQQYRIGQVLDWSLMAMIRASDLARTDESLDPEQIHRRIMEQEAAEEVRKDQEIEAACRDFVEEYSRGMRRDIDSAFSGYYPSEL